MYKKKWASVSEYESLAAADMTPNLPRQPEILAVKYVGIEGSCTESR
jgi:hypothetical protein